MKPLSKRKAPPHAAWLALAAAALHAATAQPVLEDMNVAPAGDGSAILTFTDTGSGATGYEIEYSFDLESGSWIVPEFTLQSLAGGAWRADLAGLDPARGFLRVKLLGLDGAIRAYFDPSDLSEAAEGSVATVTVYFTQPYSGPLHFRWTGAAAIENLTGVVQVDGASAQIQVSLIDNASVDELAYLSLTLETTDDTGYVLDDEAGGSTRVTLDISDNDSQWLGGFEANGLGFDIRIELLNDGGTPTAHIVGGAASILGESGSTYPADATSSSASTFHAVFTSIPGTDGAGFNLELTSDSVTEALIEGTAVLEIDPGAPHLVTTVPGTFTLARRPAEQSTTEVTLIQ